VDKEPYTTPSKDKVATRELNRQNPHVTWTKKTVKNRTHPTLVKDWPKASIRPWGLRRGLPVVKYEMDKAAFLQQMP
jgi:hypothetical protein